jgi:hypothetical protein
MMTRTIIERILLSALLAGGIAIFVQAVTHDQESSNASPATTEVTSNASVESSVASGHRYIHKWDYLE